jgi:hypothetical protein
MGSPKQDAPVDVNALAASRFRPAADQNNADAMAAFSTLIGGGGFESLPEAGKAAFRAFAVVDAIAQQPNALTIDPALEEKWKGAMQACLDAVRDARQVGIFNAEASAPNVATEVAASKDPQVKNQAPTGTKDEMSGTNNTVRKP